MGHDPNRPGDLPPLTQGVPHEPRLARNGTFSMVTGASRSWDVGVSPAAGVLGESPTVFLGFFDMKPYAGAPPNAPGLARKDWKQMGKIWGHPILRLATNATKRSGESNIFGPSLVNDQDLYRFASLSLVLSAWDNTDGAAVWDGGAANPQNPEQNTRLNQVTNQAWMGPNLLPSLTGQSTMSVDIRKWSRGARFVGVWLWPFWAGVATPPNMDFVWEMWDERPPQDNWNQTWSIAWPVRVVNMGPLAAPPDPADLLFRWGAIPGASAYRLGISNNGPREVQISWRRFFGAIAFNKEDFSVPAGAVSVFPEFITGMGGGARLNYGATHHLVYAATDSALNLGGPILVNLTAGPFGV